MVRALCFHCRGLGSILRARSKIPKPRGSKERERKEQGPGEELVQSSVADPRPVPRRKRKDSAMAMSGAGCCPWAECLGMDSRHHRVSLVTQSVKKNPPAMQERWV